MKMKLALVLCAGFTVLCSFQADAGILPKILKKSVPNSKSAVDTLVIKTLELAELILKKVPGSDNHLVQNYVANSKNWIKRKLYEDVLKKLEKFTKEFPDGKNVFLSKVKTLKNVTDGVFATLSADLDSSMSMIRKKISWEFHQWQESLHDTVEPMIEDIIKTGMKEMSYLYHVSEGKRVDLSKCENIMHQLMWEKDDLGKKIQYCMIHEFSDPYNKPWLLVEDRVRKIKNELSKVMNRSAACVRTPKTSSVRKAYCLTENIMESTHKMMDSKGELTESLLSDIKKLVVTPHPNKYCIPEDYFLEAVELLKSLMAQALQCTTELIQK